MDKNIIKLAVIEQRKIFEKKMSIIKRDIPSNFLKTRKISVISGIRRSGKSTLLKEIAQTFESYHYLNFEDERFLDFTFRDFNKLYEVFLELHGEQRAFLFDEIQNIFGWEKFARRLFEDGKKLFITGSNAKILSSELATTLSGRHLKLELFPFSFAEFLTYHNLAAKNTLDTKEKITILKQFNEYLRLGGFPEIVISENIEELKQLYQDILIKDLLVRFGIRETKSFRETALFLLSNISSPISFHKVRDVLGVKSVTTVKNYIDFMEEAYLFFAIPKFDYSVKKQIVNDRKVYAIDTGVVNAVSFKFSGNAGKILENAVFLELKRRKKEVYYHRGKRECDFVVREYGKIEEAIQVAQTIAPAETKKRELAGLREAIETYKLEKGLILTHEEESAMKENGKTITVMPIWKWMLEK